jgi:hypothetical protein
MWPVYILNDGMVIPTQSSILGKGSCSTSGFCATWMRWMLEGHGEKRSSKMQGTVLS